MSKQATIKAILFDFGQVLNAAVDLTAATEHRAAIAQQLGLTEPELWPYLFATDLALDWMSGRISPAEYWTTVLAPAGITDPAEIEAFAEHVFKGSESVHPEMEQLLEELHGRYKLAVISNADWSEEQMREDFLHKYGVPDVFDTIVTSVSAGVAKPDPAIFRLALDRLGVAAEEAIFTDDLAAFTEAAARLGIHTFTFTTPAEFRHYLVEMGVI
jgi:epoxide hydrolase-like predicted phosphatase